MKPINYFDVSVIPNEFKKKFEGCYVVLHHPKMKDEYWKINSNENGTDVQFTNQTGDVHIQAGGTITSELEIDPKYPDEGWYIVGESSLAVCIFRVPQRQWRKAPNKDNLLVRYIDHNSSLQTGGSTINFNILNATINPKDSQGNYRIINRKYLLSKVVENWHIVWYLDCVIGMYNSEKDILFTTHNWYRISKDIFKNVVYPKTFSLKDV